MAATSQNYGQPNPNQPHLNQGPTPATVQPVVTWDSIRPRWDELKLNAKKKWLKISQQDLDDTAGDREQLANRVSQAYGISRVAAYTEIDAWMLTAGQDDTVTSAQPREGVSPMSWPQIEKSWPNVKTSVKSRWSRLSDSDIASVAGDRENLVSRVMAEYGVNRAEAEKQVDAWAASVSSPDYARDSSVRPH